MTIRVFAAGQSNMLAPGTGGPPLTAVSASVSVWNSVAPLGSVGSAFVTASAARSAGTFQYTGNSMACWFCDRVARTLFDDVTLTLVARDGTSIALWDSSESQTPMLSRAAEVWSATDQPPADVFMWHQGEADLNMGATEYAERFAQLRADLEAAGVISVSALVLVGGIAESENIRAASNVEKIPLLLKMPRTAYAPSQGLPLYDDKHFTGRSAYEMGALRYFSAYRYLRSKA